MIDQLARAIASANAHKQSYVVLMPNGRYAHYLGGSTLKNKHSKNALRITDQTYAVTIGGQAVAIGSVK